jgi:hypothetical protein
VDARGLRRHGLVRYGRRVRELHAQDDTQRVQKGAYGTHCERLATLKAKCDRTNLFRMNQNIKPAA